jgi:DNA-binding response OmpR family regulator
MTTPEHILIVEDNENLRLALEDNLVDEGYRVSAVGYGRDALRVIESDVPELAIVDIMLPDTDGYAICRHIRELRLPVRVLMLTARTLESDLVAGFDAGADDYLTKPYGLRELLARVKALLRRRVDAEPGDAEQLDFSGFAVDAEARTVSTAAGEEIPLTRTEFDLLLCLLRHRNKALSREDLLRSAWERRASYRIKTVRGVGYRLEIDE